MEVFIDYSCLFITDFLSLGKKEVPRQKTGCQSCYTPHGYIAIFSLAPLAPQTFDKLRPSFGGNRSLLMGFKVPQNWRWTEPVEVGI